jgi:hypothetical protein
VIAVIVPLLRDSDFQMAWYLSAVIFAGIVLVGWAAWLVLHHLRAMWRRGDHGLAAALAAATTVALLMFSAMLVTVAVALWPTATTSAGG